MKEYPVQIFGEMELTEHIRAGGKVYSHCISIRNLHSYMGPLDEEIRTAFSDILSLEFHDIENREWMPPGSDHIPLPEKEDIASVVAFFRESITRPGFTGFTIHCWRGISRSAGIALGILYMMSEDEESAIRALISIRPKAQPLNRIVEFWDMNLNTSLKSVADGLRAERTRVILEDIGEYLANEYIEELKADE